MAGLVVLASMMHIYTNVTPTYIFNTITMKYECFIYLKQFVGFNEMNTNLCKIGGGLGCLHVAEL